MNVAGSNGLDQSLQYNLGLQVPRSDAWWRRQPGDRRPRVEGGAAGRQPRAAPEIPLGIQVGGSVTNPTVKADVGSLTSIGDAAPSRR